MSECTIALGRDEMGDGSDDATFDRWVAYVCQHIDSAVGFEVDVVERMRPGLTLFQATDPDDVRAMREGLRSVWDMWCRAGAP
jgi:hypothetical protein